MYKMSVKGDNVVKQQTQDTRKACVSIDRVQEMFNSGEDEQDKPSQSFLLEVRDF